MISVAEPRILIITRNEKRVRDLYEYLATAEKYHKIYNAVAFAFDDTAVFGRVELALDLWALGERNVLICAETCLSGML